MDVSIVDVLKAPLQMNSTHCHFVGPIVPNHLETTPLFYTPMMIYKILMLGPTNLPHTLILYSFYCYFNQNNCCFIKQPILHAGHLHP